VYNGTDPALALSFGADCIQSTCTTAPPCSEDCFFLNIWTSHLPNRDDGASTASSRRNDTTLRPVMVYLHGAGGSGSDPNADGSNVSSRGGIVVVSINFRQDTLGFLAVPGSTTTGNYAVGDMHTALLWLHAHVADFGGDPARITVIGQSMGAISVAALLSSPMVDGLVSGGIFMSRTAGAGFVAPYTRWLTVAEQFPLASALVISDAGCTAAVDPVECLRALDPFALQALPTIARYVFFFFFFFFSLFFFLLLLTFSLSPLPSVVVPFSSVVVLA
jgi:carboxylesterase type B